MSMFSRQGLIRIISLSCFILTAGCTLWTTTGYTLSVDRTYLLATSDRFIDLPQNKDDDTRVLVAKAKPNHIAEVSKMVDMSADEVTVTTGLDGYTNVNGLLVKVSME